MKRILSFADAIHEAIDLSLESNPDLFCYGLGVDDPKGVFGTTLNLHQKHGSHRVFDTPTSENAMTGIGIGAALAGCPVVMTHQRLDFFLLAMDQLVNNASKWRYMFASKASVPITIRLIIGRGWGQGPTHSQSLHSWFCHIPGLKIVSPTTPADAKGLLMASIADPNPVLFIEQRWLHQSMGEVPEGPIFHKLECAEYLKRGSDITIVAHSLMSLEALRAVTEIEKNGITCDLIDLKTLNPWDKDKVLESVSKTGRLLVLDTSHRSFSYSSEIISFVSENCFNRLKTAPIRVTLPDYPAPTSQFLTKDFYPSALDVYKACFSLMNKEIKVETTAFASKAPHDVPGEWFKGPF